MFNSWLLVGQMSIILKLTPEGFAFVIVIVALFSEEEEEKKKPHLPFVHFTPTQIFMKLCFRKKRLVGTCCILFTSYKHAVALRIFTPKQKILRAGFAHFVGSYMHTLQLATNEDKSPRGMKAIQTVLPLLTPSRMKSSLRQMTMKSYKIKTKIVHCLT